MNGDRYQKYFTPEYLMGPNCVRILENLMACCPMDFTQQDVILDLGCGKGLTSYAIAQATGAQVYANDLWISAEENAARFKAWRVDGQITPVHEDATHLRFAEKQFKAVISIDSYHYFAGVEGFFAEKILPFIADGGMAMIAVPGLKSEYEGRAEELLGPWAGDESYMFKTSQHWKKLLGEGGRIASVKTWEMDCFDKAWSEWLSISAEYSISDGKHFTSIIQPYTCFVGMAVKVAG